MRNRTLRSIFWIRRNYVFRETLHSSRMKNKRSAFAKIDSF
ncbi:hypothetical protein LEP1GSC133_2982 [Leptospira borgpetersenii serovar Pomona str. 200901868]|uniref:Uncharacterized protein n=1 Tax=Leptospira borgpetersenii serovar Pomona str. 200901868 TaxID=1192866 RepID=M6W641_LEPBO|nr:hypothetical protein LEP1GSC133_2982 [Leptospira borgpetersenii serovar Pomona str. 200901868]